MGLSKQRKADIAAGKYKGNGYKEDQIYDKLTTVELVKIGWNKYWKRAGVGNRRERKKTKHI